MPSCSPTPTPSANSVSCCPPSVSDCHRCGATHAVSASVNDATAAHQPARATVRPAGSRSVAARPATTGAAPTVRHSPSRRFSAAHKSARNVTATPPRSTNARASIVAAASSPSRRSTTVSIQVIAGNQNAAVAVRSPSDQ